MIVLYAVTAWVGLEFALLVGLFALAAREERQRARNAEHLERARSTRTVRTSPEASGPAEELPRAA